ncbi:MAG: hypothetical protein WBI17_08265 [Clostridiaceae bacterium]
MKKLGVLVLIICSFLVIATACRGNTDPIPESPVESIVETPETSTEQKKIPTSFIFELTDEEAKAYQLIREDRNEKHLQGLSPISVAKLYIQANFDKDYETEYALYDTDGVINGVGWTLEEHLKITENDPMTKEQIYENLVPLINGEFEELSDSGGVIRYQRSSKDTNEDLDMGFQVQRTEEGIWKVCFMPIQ